MSTFSQGSKPSSGWQPPSLEEMQAMLPQYHFEILIGRGGMGAVYKAVQASLDRAVAIKVLPGDLVQDDDDAQFAERFKNEARTMAKMSHPSIVNVFDFGETQTGLLYIVMEFIDGTDVAQMIFSQGRLPEEYALSITAHVCDALAYAHARGVIHRDIKPANILINVEGAVKVADFGLAKQSDPTQSGLTKTNMAMGTPDFVAPEALIHGVPLDGRADLYAIGVMLYNMLTGELPRGMWQMPALKVGSDPRFDAIIARAMENDREARYQTASEIRQELDTILALPRSVIIAQQQASAEGATAATRAQKQAEAARLAAPIAAPNPPRSQPPAKSRQSTPLLLGGLAAVGLLAAATIYLLRSPESPAGHSTAPGSTRGISPSVAPAAASGATLNPTVPTSMPAGVVSFQGHRYQFFPEKLSWDEARTKAEAAKGHLATITSPEENEWIFETFVRNLPPALSFWLGGTNNNPSRLWTWTTGEPFTFTAWGEKEPSGSPDEVALCFSSMNKGWGDIRPSGIGSMDRRGGYLVEWDDRTPMSTLPNTRPPGWIDLMATMDVARDTVSGRWLKTDAGLEIHDGPKPPVWPFEFPVTCPPEYDFEIDFTLLKGQYDISQVLPIPGHWFTVRMAANGSTIGQFLDGMADQAPGRTEARNADFELRTAQRYRSRVEVRKSSVRVLVNDKEVVAFTGDLKRLTPDPKFAMRDPTHPGVAVHMSEAVIHQAWLHPLPDGPAPSASLTMPAAVPTVAQPDAKTSSHEDLQIARLDAGFRLRYETDAQKPFLEALDKLNQSYLTNGIPKARAAAQARGSLAEVTALDAEKARVERKEAVPAEDAPDIPEALKNLRQTYRGALAKITADRDAKATPLYDIYLKSLDEHIATLTRAGKIPQAQAAQAWRDDLSRQKPALSSTQQLQ